MAGTTWRVCQGESGGDQRHASPLIAGFDSRTLWHAAASATAKLDPCLRRPEKSDGVLCGEVTTRVDPKMNSAIAVVLSFATSASYPSSGIVDVNSGVEDTVCDCRS
jgi:hypothetical protein